MKIITVTTLYPNSEQHRHGIFIENRMRQLRERYADVELKVVAPVPYFPLNSSIFGDYSKYADIPLHEQRFGVDVYHPRYLVIPKLGMHLTPFFLERAIKNSLVTILNEGYDFDLIDSHYFYPDGVAATRVAKQLNKPITVTARGSDITLIPNYPTARKRIQQTLKDVDAGIGVCQALVDEMSELEPAHSPLVTIRNGVDLALFSPLEDREKTRQELNWQKFTLLMVGNLVELKGHALVIEALKKLPDCQLVIIGEGELEQSLKSLASELGVDDRVEFVGGLKQPELPKYYGAADSLVLASSREGWANVLLESMACGTPVIATRVWGTPEVVCRPEAGILIERNVENIIEGVEQVKNQPIDRNKTRMYAEEFSWDASCETLYGLFSKLISKG